MVPSRALRRAVVAAAAARALSSTLCPLLLSGFSQHEPRVPRRYSSTPAPYGQPAEGGYMSSVGAAATPASAPGSYAQGGASALARVLSHAVVGAHGPLHALSNGYPPDYYNHPQYTQQYGYYTQ
eukprot:6186543-Pleurochrysis_carterae.AAC.4